MKKYYHITEKNNKQSIVDQGLIADKDGNIFLYDELGVSNDIALFQLGISEFTILQIEGDGVETELVSDNVAELSANSQYICHQDKIKPEFIQVFEDRKLNVFDEAITSNIKQLSFYDREFAELSPVDKLKHLHKTFARNTKFQLHIKKKIDILEEQ